MTGTWRREIVTELCFDSLAVTGEELDTVQVVHPFAVTDSDDMLTSNELALEIGWEPFLAVEFL